MSDIKMGEAQINSDNPESWGIKKAYEMADAIIEYGEIGQCRMTY